MCIQLLLVSGLLSGFGFPFLSPREFSGFTPHDVVTEHKHNQKRKKKAYARRGCSH